MNSMDMLYEKIKGCTMCGLCTGRRHTVPGEGNTSARLMFVGEGPGADEDRLGRPFVGRAGQLLDRMLDAIDVKREEVYIANIVKCRPPGNRNPERIEIEECIKWLNMQLDIIKPEIIVCLGGIAAKTLIDPASTITEMRGRIIEKDGYKFLATFHPAALLRNPGYYADAWKDMRTLRDELLDSR